MSTTAHSDFWQKVNGAFSGSISTDQTPLSAQTSPPTLTAASQLDQTQELDVLDRVLTEVEQQVSQPVQPVEPAPVVSVKPSTDPLASVAQVMPQAVAQATDTLNPTGAIPVAKEKFVDGLAVNTGAAEVGGSSGPAEVEPAREQEMPVEVESYLQKVDNNPDQLPQEIVVADDGQTVHTKAFPKQPVIVLPLTEEQIEQGKKKSLKLSIRWLVEWSEKIMKMFNGKVIYRQVEE